MLEYYLKTLLKSVAPNLVLFVYVSTLYYAETVKLLDLLVQLARWSTDNASDCSPRVPGFDSRLLQGYLCLLCCCAVEFLLFWSKHRYLS